MNTRAHPSFEKPDYRIILRWRWLVLLIGLLLNILFELVEGHELDDFHLWADFFFYGLALPFVTWLLLTLLAHNMAQRARREDYHERYRRFTQQLAQYQAWDELTRFVAQFPGTLLPVEHASLYIYDHRNARLEFAAKWNAAGVTPPAIPSLPFDICRACLLAKPTEIRALDTTCVFALGANGDQLSRELCLPLAYDSVLVGLLRLRHQPGKTLTPEEREFLNAAAPEIALALALSIAHPRQMAQVRLEAQLTERQRAAYELHNSLAQQIGYLHLSLDRLASDDGLLKHEDVRDELERMREVANGAYQQIRNTLSALRSRELGDLSQVIADHARTVARQTNLQLDFTTRGAPVLLSPQACEQLFRLLQEGLHNVEKHARAQQVRIALDWSADSLNMSLVDDGIGFAPSAPPQEGHYGLAMMHEQVEALGGELTLNSFPGKGTQLLFRVPLQRLQAQTTPAG